MKLYGPETTKSVLNFPLSKRRVDSSLIKAVLIIKKAAAMANFDLGLIDQPTLAAIVGSCDELTKEKYNNQFVTDEMQGGAGTSINMNVCEVVASLASSKSQIKIHPLDHVNKSQSTNDVLPTALRIVLLGLLEELTLSLSSLAKVFGKKALEFKDIRKVGRTHLQDAVPIALGAEWQAYGNFTKRCVQRVKTARRELLVTNLGGTAIGTGVGAPTKYPKLVHKYLRKLTGYNLTPAKNLVDATQNIDSFVAIEHTLAIISGGLGKIASDMRLLASGPKAGIRELVLPNLQKGSTIMPGKINPVTLEAVNQVAFDIAGKTQTIQIIYISGQLELNVYFPLLAKNLIETATLLINVVKLFAKTAEKVEADKAKIRKLLVTSVIQGAQRALEVGYDKSEKEVLTKLSGNIK